MARHLPSREEKEEGHKKNEDNRDYAEPHDVSLRHNAAI